jgi:uncharacterized membrane protein
VALTLSASELLTVTAVTGSAVAGGFYTAFSVVVMPALRSRAAAEAVQTMNSINRNAVRPPFMTVFFGTAVASTLMGAGGIAAADVPGVLRTSGAVLYLFGFGLTVAHNVPLNTRLAALPAAAAAKQWPGWESRWTRSNTVRAVVSLAGAVLMAAGR